MKNLIASLALLVSVSAQAGIEMGAVYECLVDTKFEMGEPYPDKFMDKYLYVARFILAPEGAVVHRCSLLRGDMDAELSCDEYISTDVTMSGPVNHKILKVYLTDSHFDLQVFSDLAFIENNGRGSVAYGVCEKLEGE